ncbi:MAG TPA: DNA methyltransferase, partial [Candidatus Obscuribacterales bacterium]
SPSPRGRGVGVRAIRDSLRNAEKPITPFSWEIEFPEVFDRENPGFDAIVGNPPFAGKNTTINSNPDGYVDWLKVVHPEAHGNADLVAHFFRRAFTIIRHGGAFGLIATNTIAQGDTRSTGLRYICHHGGIIYNATRRYRWPGVAAVVVSLVHIWKQADAMEDTQ